MRDEEAQQLRVDRTLIGHVLDALIVTPSLHTFRDCHELLMAVAEAERYRRPQASDIETQGLRNYHRIVKISLSSELLHLVDRFGLETHRASLDQILQASLIELDDDAWVDCVLLLIDTMGLRNPAGRTWSAVTGAALLRYAIQQAPTAVRPALPTLANRVVATLAALRLYGLLIVMSEFLRKQGETYLPLSIQAAVQFFFLQPVPAGPTTTNRLRNAVASLPQTEPHERHLARRLQRMIRRMELRRVVGIDGGKAAYERPHSPDRKRPGLLVRVLLRLDCLVAMGSLVLAAVVMRMLRVDLVSLESWEPATRGSFRKRLAADLKFMAERRFMSVSERAAFLGGGWKASRAVSGLFVTFGLAGFRHDRIAYMSELAMIEANLNLGLLDDEPDPEAASAALIYLSSLRCNPDFFNPAHPRSQELTRVLDTWVLRGLREGVESHQRLVSVMAAEASLDWGTNRLIGAGANDTSSPPSLYAVLRTSDEIPTRLRSTQVWPGEGCATVVVRLIEDRSDRTTLAAYISTSSEIGASKVTDVKPDQVVLPKGADPLGTSALNLLRQLDLTMLSTCRRVHIVGDVPALRLPWTQLLLEHPGRIEGVTFGFSLGATTATSSAQKSDVVRLVSLQDGTLPGVRREREALANFGPGEWMEAHDLTTLHEILTRHEPSVLLLSVHGLLSESGQYLRLPSGPVAVGQLAELKSPPTVVLGVCSSGDLNDAPFSLDLVRMLQMRGATRVVAGVGMANDLATGDLVSYVLYQVLSCQQDVADAVWSAQLDLIGGVTATRFRVYAS